MNTKNIPLCCFGRVFAHYVDYFLSNHFCWKSGIHVGLWMETLSSAQGWGEKGFQRRWLSRQQLLPPLAPPPRLTCQGLEQIMRHCPRWQNRGLALWRSRALELQESRSCTPAPWAFREGEGKAGQINPSPRSPLESVLLPSLVLGIIITILWYHRR